ncbi:MAG: RNA pseudouridine synthase [Betaproteobacteria bacterium]
MDPKSDGPQAPEEGQRLAKWVAARVPCSRREAEQYITEGWVRVDGQLADAPQMRVTEHQRVTIDPKARLQAPVSATFLVHKPAGMLATTDLLLPAHRFKDDASGIRSNKTHHIGLQMLLALPHPASGLCIFSQDARVLRKLTEDAALIEQELLAEVQGQIAPDGLARLCHGLQRHGRPLPPARVSWQSETRLRFAVKGIAPDAIEWMCAQVGLQLQALRRIRIGRIAMAALPPGQWRYLPAGERF